MITHHIDLTPEELRSKIRSGELRYGGNKKLKIYGTISCRSGRRMKRGNRVFFTSAEDAIQLGYRPCGVCLKYEYQQWKKRT